MFDDTEIGQEEWRIFTESTTPSVAAFIEVSADVGEGEVAINHTFPGRRLLPRSVFPLFASVVVSVEELDDVFNERSGDLSGGARGLPCPGSRTLHLSVHGEGPDAFPEDFDVLLTYRWDVRRF